MTESIFAFSRELTGEELLTQLRNAVEVEIVSFLNEAAIGAAFKEVLTYALIPGGKRIRPLLALLVCRDLGGEYEKLIPGAVALELIHCASLVHDDLPAIDNDDYRRGRPALHIRYSEASAILAGDALPALIAALLKRSSLKSTLCYQILNYLLDAQLKISEGQFLDLSESAREQSLLGIHRLKTGALFGTALAIGAIGAEREGDEQLYDFGVQLGVYFQLVDDLIDIFCDSGDTGKLESSDLKNDRHTWFSKQNPTAGLERLEGIELQLLQRLEGLKRNFAEPSFDGIRLIFSLIRERKEQATGQL